MPNTYIDAWVNCEQACFSVVYLIFPFSQGLNSNDIHTACKRGVLVVCWTVSVKKNFQNSFQRTYRNKLTLGKIDSNAAFLRRELPISWIKPCRNDSHNSSVSIWFMPTAELANTWRIWVCSWLSTIRHSALNMRGTVVTIGAASIMAHNNRKAFSLLWDKSYGLHALIWKLPKYFLQFIGAVVLFTRRERREDNKARRCNNGPQALGYIV